MEHYVKASELEELVTQFYETHLTDTKLKKKDVLQFFSFENRTRKPKAGAKKESEQDKKKKAPSKAKSKAVTVSDLTDRLSKEFSLTGAAATGKYNDIFKTKEKGKLKKDKLEELLEALEKQASKKAANSKKSSKSKPKNKKAPKSDSEVEDLSEVETEDEKKETEDEAEVDGDSEVDDK